MQIKNRSGQQMRNKGLSARSHARRRSRQRLYPRWAGRDPRRRPRELLFSHESEPGKLSLIN